jgi:predicted Zn-ribbon and HTH transcriptional regulator
MIGAECVITLEVIYNDTDCGFCPTCKKAMRYDALREWLKDNDTCPHCRSEWSNNIVYK